ncbi:hypothetical protein H7I95_22345 [Mycolicibacterium elephantis]|uniref:Uncharacterized protein n=2 Tax=Mycolicibacterium elephantis TaxID=81858 RepID=A0A439DXZ3_9MYCO|nr:hypothetical protein [Mycolicibacterium elephantis]RWA22345.1 hypothetical protein MELE44368_13105 [Mycolicibacterium elephantis DSM 44368]
MESWRARLGVLASRGETSGPRVDECRAALSFWRMHATLVRELHISDDEAHSLLTVIEQHGNREAVAR